MLELSNHGREFPLRSLVDEAREHSLHGQTAIVGVDGRAGSGKTTLCQALAAIDPTISVVHTDEFYVPPTLRTSPKDEVGRQIDWRRILTEVVTPLLEGRPAHYQCFDWDAQCLDKWVDVHPSDIVLLDGVYSTREELAPFLAYRIWVHVPRDLGLERGITRDGNETWWAQDWIEDEDRYVLMEQPEAQADAVVDGTIDASLYARGFCRRLH